VPMDNKDLWKLYHKTIHKLRGLDSRVWTETDLTMPQIKIMFILGHRGELNVSSIADILRVRVPNVTFILDNLKEHGFITRKRDQKDRRQVIITLTERGHQAIHKLTEAKSESFNKALSRMNDQDKGALWQGLQALDQACSEDETGGIDE
jgi:DNA-binding MarR family transcriptional regulator